MPSFLYNPQHGIKLEYHAIDVTFEYMAAKLAPRMRFFKEKYPLDENGLIIIDEGNDLRMELSIEQAQAAPAGYLSASSTGTLGEAGSTSVAGKILISDWPKTDITDDDSWRDNVEYVGTQGRFEQKSAGPYWHVIETITIKARAINPPESALGFLGFASS